MTYAYDDIVTAKDIRTGKVRKEDIIGKQGWFFNTIPSDMSEDAIEHIEPSVYGVLTDISMADTFPFYEAGCNSWTCFLPEKKKPYEERQAEWIEANGIEIGDKVRILRKYEPYEDGCSSEMDREGRMDRLIGTVGEVCSIARGSIGVADSTFYPWAWPYFCLERAKEEIAPFKLSRAKDRDALRGRWIKDKAKGNEWLISGFSIDETGGQGWKARLTRKSSGATGRELLERYTFLDGSPVGKKEEA